MTFQPGTRLSPYEITAAIGAGGMGEVYRARDSKLDRDVAIKVLPDLFAADLTRSVPRGLGGVARAVPRGLGGCGSGHGVDARTPV